MILDDLIKRCNFDLSKASKNVKTTIVSLTTLMIATNALAAPRVNLGDAFLLDEQSKYTQEISSNAHTKTLQTWDYMLERTEPDKSGSEYLEKMENMGVVKTPITYAEYYELANPSEGQSKTEIFRNPLSKDGIVIMSSGKVLERMNPIEAVFLKETKPMGKYEGTAFESYMSELDNWKEIKNSREDIKDIKSEMTEKLDSIVGGLKNDTVKEKFGFKARKTMHGGLEYRFTEIAGPAISGLSDGVARNPGGKFYMDDGTTKINISSLYAGASNSYQVAEATEVLTQEMKVRDDVDPEHKKFFATDFISVDRELANSLSYDEKEKVTAVQTLAHEVFHGVLSYSTNSAQPSLMFNSFMHAFNNSGAESSELTVDKVNVRDMGAYRLNHESTSDMAALSIVASGASDAEWEYAKLANQAIRKQSYLGIEVFHDNSDPNYKMDVKGANLNLGGNEQNIYANHDVLFLVAGWVDALDQAREGNDPNNLLALANEPVKLGMAIQFANAVVMKDLEGMTNDWKSLPKDEYVNFIEKTSELMTNYTQSDEFKSVLDGLDTTKHEPNLGLDVQATMKIAEPTQQQKLKI